MVQARCEQAKVVGLRSCGPDAFILELEFFSALPEIEPGQFAMLSLGDGNGPILPRPFSFYGRLGSARLTFLIQVIGFGTRLLANLQISDLVQVTFPLGQGFALPSTNQPLVMIAGGVGLAPFLLLGQQRVLQQSSGSTALIFGARTENRLYDRATFEQLGIETYFATDDGSLGFSGNVLECLASLLNSDTVSSQAQFFACGPEPLLKSFSVFARSRNLAGQVSLETYMGCGYGACNACPVATNPKGALGEWPWAKTCKEGPTFALDAVNL